MLGRFPRLSKVAIRILEIAGAGCASALAALVLGNSHEPPHPPAPPPVVRLAPADEQMIRYVRNESVALAEQLRTASDARNGAAIAPAAAATPAPKPAKAATAASTRREQKANRAQPPELRQRPGEPLPIQSAMASPGPEPARAPAGSAPVASDARDARTPPAAAAPSESGLSSTQTQVPSRLWPAAASSLRDAPRPPLGVGESPSSSM
jgi:hypothetical protein